MANKSVTVMGSYVAGLAASIAYPPGRDPHGHSFQLGPGGKGSNHAVAAESFAEGRTKPSGVNTPRRTKTKIVRKSAPADQRASSEL